MNMVSTGTTYQPLANKILINTEKHDLSMVTLRNVFLWWPGSYEHTEQVMSLVYYLRHDMNMVSIGTTYQPLANKILINTQNKRDLSMVTLRNV